MTNAVTVSPTNNARQDMTSYEQAEYQKGVAMVEAIEKRLAKKAAYKAKEAAKRGEREAGRRSLRRANALDRHARLVYDTDRDIGGEFSAE